MRFALPSETLGRRLRERLEAAGMPPGTARVDFRSLAALPAPVQRYLRTVLEDGRPTVRRVRMRHRGSFNTGTRGNSWKAFTSDQLVVVRRPGFDWDARIRLAPGMPVHVHDAYAGGEGILNAALFGVVPLARVRGGGEIARSELMRFLAEAAWYPTALLPGNDVTWEAVDAQRARATLVDGPCSATLTFTFDASGLVVAVRTEARGRTVGRRLVPAPWQGRFWDYEERSGMRIPIAAEAAWLLPGGPRPYWRGRIEEIAYDFGDDAG